MLMKLVLVITLLSCSGCREDPQYSQQPLPESVHAYRIKVTMIETTKPFVPIKKEYSIRIVKPDPNVVYPILRVTPSQCAAVSMMSMEP